MRTSEADVRPDMRPDVTFRSHRRLVKIKVDSGETRMGSERCRRQTQATDSEGKGMRRSVADEYSLGRIENRGWNGRFC